MIVYNIEGSPFLNISKAHGNKLSRIVVQDAFQNLVSSFSGEMKAESIKKESSTGKVTLEKLRVLERFTRLSGGLFRHENCPSQIPCAQMTYIGAQMDDSSTIRLPRHVQVLRGGKVPDFGH